MRRHEIVIYSLTVWSFLTNIFVTVVCVDVVLLFCLHFTQHSRMHAKVSDSFLTMMSSTIIEKRFLLLLLLFDWDSLDTPRGSSRCALWKDEMIVAQSVNIYSSSIE